MKRITFGLFGILILSLIGCGVSKDKYMQLEKEKQQLEDRAARLQREKQDLASALEEVEVENQRLLTERQQLQTRDQEEARRDALKQSQPLTQETPATLDADYK